MNQHACNWPSMADSQLALPKIRARYMHVSVVYTSKCRNYLQKKNVLVYTSMLVLKNHAGPCAHNRSKSKFLASRSCCLNMFLLCCSTNPVRTRQRRLFSRTMFGKVRHVWTFTLMIKRSLHFRTALDISKISTTGMRGRRTQKSGSLEHTENGGDPGVVCAAVPNQRPQGNRKQRPHTWIHSPGFTVTVPPPPPPPPLL